MSSPYYGDPKRQLVQPFAKSYAATMENQIDRLEPDIDQNTPHGAYRVTRDCGVFELQAQTRDRWDDIYQFTLDPQSHVDFDVANWFTSTHPRSLFTQNLIVCRVVGDTRVNLLNTRLSVRLPDGQFEQRVLEDANELDKLLNDVMNLELPVSSDPIWAKASSAVAPPTDNGSTQIAAALPARLR
jgi:N-hydroxyarylamine O-acetyltransferase